MPSVMIIGASRGIGLGFVQAYAAADGWQVHATTRTIDAPGELGEVPGDVTLYQLDVIDAGQIRALAMALEAPIPTTRRWIRWSRRDHWIPARGEHWRRRADER